MKRTKPNKFLAKIPWVGTKYLARLERKDLLQFAASFNSSSVLSDLSPFFSGMDGTVASLLFQNFTLSVTHESDGTCLSFQAPSGRSVYLAFNKTACVLLEAPSPSTATKAIALMNNISERYLIPFVYQMDFHHNGNVLCNAKSLKEGLNALTELIENEFSLTPSTSA